MTSHRDKCHRRRVASSSPVVHRCRFVQSAAFTLSHHTIARVLSTVGPDAYALQNRSPFGAGGFRRRLTVEHARPTTAPRGARSGEGISGSLSRPARTITRYCQDQRRRCHELVVSKGGAAREGLPAAYLQRHALELQRSPGARLGEGLRDSARRACAALLGRDIAFSACSSAADERFVTIAIVLLRRPRTETTVCGG